MSDVPELLTALDKLAIPSDRKRIAVKCDWTLEREPLGAPHIQRLGKALATRPNINDVSLQGFILEKEAVDALSQIAVSRQLVQLDLSFCRIGDRATDELCRSIKLGKVEWLDLTYNTIGLLGINRIARTIDSSVCTLRVLSVRYNPITSFGLGLLLKYGTTLITIDARCCGILCGDDAVTREYGLESIITGIECNKNIERVLLQGNGFKPEEEAQIHAAIKNSNTSLMTKETCPIIDAEVDAFLSGLVSLNTTMTKYNKVGSAAAVALRKESNQPIPEVIFNNEEMMENFESISQLENPEPVSPLIEHDYTVFDLERKETIPIGWGNGAASDNDSIFSEESGIVKVNSIVKVGTPTSCASLSPRYRRKFLRRMTAGSDDFLNELSRSDTMPLGIEGRFRGSWQLLASIMKTTPESSPQEQYARQLSSEDYVSKLGNGSLGSFGGLPPPEVPLFRRLTSKELPHVPDVKRLDSIIVEKRHSGIDLLRQVTKTTSEGSTLVAGSDDFVTEMATTEPPSPLSEDGRVATEPSSPAANPTIDIQLIDGDVCSDGDGDGEGDSEGVATVPPSIEETYLETCPTIPVEAIEDDDSISQAATIPPTPNSPPRTKVDIPHLTSKDIESLTPRTSSTDYRYSDSQDYAGPIINRFGGGPRGWPVAPTRGTGKPIKHHPKAVTSATRSSVAKYKPVTTKPDVPEQLWRASPGMWPERTTSYDKTTAGISDRLAQQTHSSMQRSQTFSAPDAKQQHLVNTTEVVDNPLRAISARGTNEKDTYMLLEAALTCDECAKTLLGTHAYFGLGASCGSAQGLPDYLKQHNGYPSAIAKIPKNSPNRASAIAKLLHMLVDPASGAKPDPGADRVLRNAYRRRLSEVPILKKNDFKVSLALLRQIRWSKSGKKLRVTRRAKSPPREGREDIKTPLTARVGIVKNKSVFDVSNSKTFQSDGMYPPQRRASLDTYDSFVRSARRGSLDQERLSRFNSAILPPGKGSKRSPTPPKINRSKSPPQQPRPAPKEPVIVPSAINKKESTAPPPQQPQPTPKEPVIVPSAINKKESTAPPSKSLGRKSPTQRSETPEMKVSSPTRKKPKSPLAGKPRSPVAGELALRRQLSDGVYGIVSTGKKSPLRTKSSPGELFLKRINSESSPPAKPPARSQTYEGEVVKVSSPTRRVKSPLRSQSRERKNSPPPKIVKSSSGNQSCEVKGVIPREIENLLLSLPNHIKRRTHSPPPTDTRGSSNNSSRFNSMTHQHPRNRSPASGFSRSPDRFSRIDSVPNSGGMKSRTSSFTFTRQLMSPPNKSRKSNTHRTHVPNS